MPITTSETRTIVLEKKILRIDINDNERRIDYQIRYRTMYDDTTIIKEQFFNIQVEGDMMLELAGVSPRLEVPSGLTYREALQNRSYEFFDVKGLWPR